jgi:hypothetical protein
MLWEGGCRRTSFSAQFSGFQVVWEALLGVDSRTGTEANKEP